MPDISQLQKSTHENIFSSPEFLGEKKPPEIVGVIPKAPKDAKGSPSKYGSFGKRRFQIGTSLIENFDVETASLYSRNSNDSKNGSISRNSVNSALECFNFVDEFSDLDENVFSGSKSQPKRTSDEIFNQLFGIHNLDEIKISKNQSISSLRSLTSLPGFLGSGTGMKKWKSILSTNVSTTIDSLASISSCPNGSITAESIKASDKSFGSTDSGIAQENHIEKQSEADLDISVNPPPPSVVETNGSPNNISQPLDASELATTLKLESNPIKPNTEAEAITEPEHQPTVSSLIPPTETKSKTETSARQSEPELVKKSIPEIVAAPSPNLELIVETKDPEISEIDWQYQLPSPPKAFRDSSPTNFTKSGDCESESATDFKDSVVTSPELFEKLKTIEDCQSEKGTLTSDVTSVVSEEDKPLAQYAFLGAFRETKVFNTKNITADTFSSSLTQFESTYDEIRKSSLPKETPEPKYLQPNVSVHTLPNFKISTYDQPKQKIKVFEDDTIRSNTDNYLKVNTVVETSVSTSMSKTFIGRSMENVSVRKNSLESQLTQLGEEKGYKMFRPKAPARNFGPQSLVFRSESFSNENSWSPSKPVSRSKSHLTLNAHKYREEHVEQIDGDSISRSNSLYDVSGLQSLEVMKLIQNKLNTPTSSTENLNQNERHQKVYLQQESRKPNVSANPSAVEPQKPSPPERIYKYQGPPSINMGTWSEHHKPPVSVREDTDYKLSNNVSSKLIVNTINNNITSSNSVEESNVSINGFNRKESNNVSIKVNGNDPIISTQNSGNVVIKIGSLNPQTYNPKPIDSQMFINHTTASGYRKPFTNINKNQPTQRPHSVAFDSDFDISRVPVVRSVELKKPFKDLSNNNTSVTQIYQGNNNPNRINRSEPVSELKNKFSNMYRSSETLYNNKNGIHKPEAEPKPVFRANSFKPTIAPVVRGFKTPSDNANINSRLSWNSPTSYSTLPAKPKEVGNYSASKQIPFSQANLRRTESIEVNNERNNSYNSPQAENKGSIIKPPPPPLMPKMNLKRPVPKPVQSNMDPRDQLLSAIRNFGGKKGLKAVKT
ncbi:hypothetical protein NQ318_016596 [Aromia moschata]|uniref:WH2 domain-containing protein n=1 Tax=Aromia moschata TaxID=1265417 RepID=A0AAV8Y0E0_9CUCU|nr:hypothetical protein NQ318_016596 [Aromia moschata]